MSWINGSELKSASRRSIVTLLAFSAIPACAQNAAAVKPTRSTRIVLVSIADRQLAVTEAGKVVAKFPIAVGAAVSPSPTGEFTIVNRVSNPAYYHHGSVIPSGENNPVGTRWLGLNKKGYGIHGTNEPRSIGHGASHGCIRLRNRDMERLFTMLQVGDVVQIHGERDEQVAQIFGTQADDTTVAAAENESPAGDHAGISSPSSVGDIGVEF
jgi:lipoprotein-anchoring transpeptidase ErfK/SrfK